MSEIKTNKISPRKGTTQTIGDSGDTVSIPCGVTTTNAGTISTAGITGGTIDNQGGTISGIGGVIEWDTTAKTSAFTAEANKGYFVNTTSSTITVTLPASPSAGDVIAVKDYANTFDTNKLTLDANGNKIQGSTIDFDITVEGANSQFIYVDSTRGWVLTDASKASDIAEVALFISASGGTETTCGDFKIHTFTSPGTFCVSQIGNGPTNPAGGPTNVDYMVVAGGGAGGNGGGGAGGFRTTFPSPGCNAGSFPITATAFPITVGGGGAPSGGSGSNSVFSTITSAGGGGAGATNNPAEDGGSGGGGASNRPTAGSGNTPPVSPPQGNPGGPGSPGGGGGGGANAAGSPGGSNGGAGGSGSPNSINGTATTRAGGGGGGAPGSGGAGGAGGGGAGGPNGAGDGTVNTGGGGGGNWYGGNIGSGGSGIVIIRYKYQ
jgi:hypothetical protein